VLGISNIETSENIRIDFLPSQPATLLAVAGPDEQAAGRPGFVLHAVARLHRPELKRYYGSI